MSVWDIFTVLKNIQYRAYIPLHHAQKPGKKYAWVCGLPSAGTEVPPGSPEYGVNKILLIVFIPPGTSQGEWWWGIGEGKCWATLCVVVAREPLIFIPISDDKILTKTWHLQNS